MCFMVIRRVHVPSRSLTRERIFGTDIFNKSPLSLFLSLSLFLDIHLFSSQ